MNNTQIPIDELYDQLTLILQEEKYAKSTIQLYQEHVKRIKKFMLANNITVYWSSFLVTLCSEIMLYIETPLVSYSYSLNEVSHSCTS